MSLKKIICTSLSICAAFGAFAQKARVKGNIKDLGDTQFVISYTKGDKPQNDTIKAKGGQFTWEADMPEPQKVYMMFPTRYAQFYAESGNIEITGDAAALHQLKVSGSRTQDEADAYTKSLKDLSDQQSPLYQRYGKGDAKEQLEIEQKLEALRVQRAKRAKDYIAAHPESPFSLNLVADRAVMESYEEVKPLYDLLDASQRKSTGGKKLEERLGLLKRSAIGANMLEFTQNDTTGKAVQYAAFKGKYVLVDFWASWCGPCRAENPNVLKAYNKYKDKNFTVVGVSLDEDAAKWKKAIVDDGMPWSQVSDLQGFKNEVSSYYGIQGIPSTLLVDPQGKIIARNLRGELLQDKLAELFK